MAFEAHFISECAQAYFAASPALSQQAQTALKAAFDYGAFSF
jgi:hypothetical protein